MKANIKHIFRDYGLILIGSMLFAVYDVMFAAPYKLAPGGVYGIANVLSWLFNWRISYIAIAFEVPLLIIGTWLLGPKFGVKTVVSVILINIFVWMLEHFPYDFVHHPIIHNDILVSSICAGVICGLASGLIFRTKATSGGTDIVSMIGSKYTGLTLGRMVFIVDGIVTCFSFTLGDITLPIYSFITLIVSVKVIDMVVEGIKSYKTVMIVSDKHEELKPFIMNTLSRGATYLEGEGMYSGDKKRMIYTVVDRKEFSDLRDKIYDIDPNAFINVLDSSETLGYGFKQLEKSK